MRIKARVVAQAGDPATARGWLVTARTAAADLGARFFALRIANDLACLPQSAEDRAEAEASLARIHDTFDEGHGTPDLIRAAHLRKSFAAARS